MSGCESNTSFNDEDLNINGEDISDIFILEDNLSNSLESSYSFIALGDSYTIGEGVNENERWPNQFVDVAYENGVDFDQPIIIAETGWKTYDLLNAINQTNFTKKYDYVSLLIGVNNQFNSRPIDEFEQDLNDLMEEMKKIKKNDGSIIIISIPDWGYSPFGESSDMIDISSQIDLFNSSLRKFASTNNLKFVDVTEISRRGIDEPNLIAGDSLHPSGIMYLEWAKKIYEIWID
jgi:lysophospholipase L1-like esterase|tara:strand:- start:116 stop:817 length:702 start_codon:yes stop_codon:yes gene_type:complete